MFKGHKGSPHSPGSCRTKYLALWRWPVGLIPSRMDASQSIPCTLRDEMVPGSSYTEQCMCDICCLHLYRGGGKNHSNLENAVHTTHLSHAWTSTSFIYSSICFAYIIWPIPLPICLWHLNPMGKAWTLISYFPIKDLHCKKSQHISCFLQNEKT